MSQMECHFTQITVTTGSPPQQCLPFEASVRSVSPCRGPLLHRAAAREAWNLWSADLCQIIDRTVPTVVRTMGLSVGCAAHRPNLQKFRFEQFDLVQPALGWQKGPGKKGRKGGGTLLGHEDLHLFDVGFEAVNSPLVCRLIGRAIEVEDLRRSSGAGPKILRLRSRNRSVGHRRWFLNCSADKAAPDQKALA